MENQAKCLKNDEKSIYIYILAKFSWGGGKSGRVFEILEKKNSRAPAGTELNSVGRGMENQSQSVRNFGDKKFKGSRGHLAKFSWGGGKSEPECLKFWRKKIQGFPRTLS